MLTDCAEDCYGGLGHTAADQGHRQFGASLAVSEGLALVGEPGDWARGEDRGGHRAVGNFTTGAAYLYAEDRDGVRFE